LDELASRHQAESSELGELIGTTIPELERRLNELQVPRIVNPPA
jgi:hypothetical protein